ncbi:MAG: hypothetical protein HUK18_02295 [Bacteroidales bacterium]|nr:hypothetical protein [Bacteroidales bacterium]
MSKLSISKVLDYLATISIVVLVALYLFLHLNFQTLALSLIGILLVKMLAYMLRAKHFEQEYNKLKDEVRDIIK